MRFVYTINSYTCYGELATVANFQYRSKKILPKHCHLCLSACLPACFSLIHSQFSFLSLIVNVWQTGELSFMLIQISINVKTEYIYGGQWLLVNGMVVVWLYFTFALWPKTNTIETDQATKSNWLFGEALL